MSAAKSSGGFRKVEDRYSGYDVVDVGGEKVGSVDHTFVDEGNQREYIAVKRLRQ